MHAYLCTPITAALYRVRNRHCFTVSPTMGLREASTASMMHRLLLCPTSFDTYKHREVLCLEAVNATDASSASLPYRLSAPSRASTHLLMRGRGETLYPVQVLHSIEDASEVQNVTLKNNSLRTRCWQRLVEQM